MDLPTYLAKINFGELQKTMKQIKDTPKTYQRNGIGFQMTLTKYLFGVETGTPISLR